jgi:hypothetical protein
MPLQLTSYLSLETALRASSGRGRYLRLDLDPHGEEPRFLRGVSNHEAPNRFAYAIPCRRRGEVKARVAP